MATTVSTCARSSPAPEVAGPIGELMLRYDFFNRDERVAPARARLALQGTEISTVFELPQKWIGAVIALSG